jgi:hypothetical protein
MAKEQFEELRFSNSKIALIETCNQIIEDFQAQGYDLTLRQLYYQLVSRNIIPNKDSEYKKLGNDIGRARLAGLVDWSAIVDRTRSVQGPQKWESPQHIISAVSRSYHIDYWEGQMYRVTVLVEKDAMRGVISQAARGRDSSNFSCRGYPSLTEMYKMGKSIRTQVYKQSLEPIFLHLGDHDPSGVDMTRDLIERLELFSGLKEGIHFHVERIALNMDQINLYTPPPNPAKITDSRASGYIRLYGNDSWELDALDPSVLDALIKEKIDQYIDYSLWDKRIEQEEREKADLKKISSNYKYVIKALNGKEKTNE